MKGETVKKAAILDHAWCAVVCFHSGKMAGSLKKATYLTGMAVCTNPRYTLDRLYQRILKVVSKMPENAAYRKATTEIVQNRLQVVKSTDDWKVIEEKIGCGQVEELIIQAKKELELAESFLLSRPWESLIAPIPKNQWKWPMK